MATLVQPDRACSASRPPKPRPAPRWPAPPRHAPPQNNAGGRRRRRRRRRRRHAGPGDTGVDPGNIPAPERRGRRRRSRTPGRRSASRTATRAPARTAFDCSGLTMMAWAQGGVGMSHGSQSQYLSFPHVPISQLQPGDLVFFGSSGPSNHHVGLYVGGGTMIEAPHTGAFVRYATIYRARPRTAGIAPVTTPSLPCGRDADRPSGSRPSRTARAAPASCRPPTSARCSVSCAGSTGRPIPTCSSASTPPTTRRSTACATTSPSSSPPTSSRRSSTTRSTGAASRRPTRSSDVYAMGGTPLLALNLVAWPREALPFELLARVLDGGAAVARAAGCLIAGGHSIDDAEPKYGLAVVGTVHPDARAHQRGRPTRRRARAHQADRARRDLDRGEARRRDRRHSWRRPST